MKIKILKIIFFSTLLLTVANSAFAVLPADLRVYTSHGEINTLHEAFMKISLIASDARYIGLCYTVLVLSFLVTAYNVFGGKGIIGQMGTPDMLHWIFTFLAACVILRAFIIPTTNLTIDDVTTNQTVTIPNVPDGMVLLVNGMNLVENAMLEIVATAGTPDGFVQNPGGTGFNILSKMFEKQIELSGIVGGGGSDISTSIQYYIKDCVAFAMQNNGSGLTLDNLMSNVDYTPILALAANPAVFTSSANGTTISCSAAYINIAAYIAALNDAHPDVDTWVERSCAEAAWYDDPWAAIPLLGAAKKITCRDSAIDFLKIITNEPGLTAAQVFRQILISQELYRFTTSEDINAGIVGGGSYSQGNSMVSAGLLSAEWMPQIKSMMLAAFLGMSPFLLVFLASTMWKKVLAFMFGCLTFFTVWSLCDVVMHDFAMTKALAVLRDVAQGKLGYKSVLMFSDDSMKAYAVFGQYRVWSMALAVFFSGALVKGGSELGRIAAARGSDMKSTADSAGADMTDPVRNANKREGLVAAVPTQGLYNAGAYDSMQSVAAHQKQLSVATSRAKMEALGGTNRAPDIAANNEAAVIAYQVEASEANMIAADTVSSVMDMPRKDMLRDNSITASAEASGKTKAYFNEGGGSVAGVVGLVNQMSAFGIDKNLAEMGAFKKGAANTGESVKSLLNGVADVTAAKAIEDAASFKSSAETHYGPGDKGMYAMAKDFANINNETGVGRNQALRAVAAKHYGGPGNIAAVEKDLQSFNRLKNVADKQAHDAIAEKHFGGDDEKMYAAMAMASVAKASGDAVAQKEVAKNYFHGDQHDMNKAASLYDNSVKASKHTSLGSGLKSTAKGVGEYDAGADKGKANVNSTIGSSGVEATSAASDLGNKSRAIWSSLTDSMANGRPMEPKMRQALANMIRDPESRAQLNANGGGLYLHMPNDQGKAIALGKKLGMSEADSASLAGSGITLTGGVDEQGRLSFTNTSSKAGTSIYKGDENTRGYAGALARIQSGAYDSIKPIAQRLMDSRNNTADRTIDGKGGSSQQLEIRALTAQLTKEMQDSGHSRTGRRDGTLTSSGSSSFNLGLGNKKLGAGVGGAIDYSDRSSDGESANLVTTTIRRGIGKALAESGNSVEILSQKLDQYVGNYVRDTLNETQEKKPTDYGGDAILDSGAGDVKKIIKDRKY